MMGFELILLVYVGTIAICRRDAGNELAYGLSDRDQPAAAAGEDLVGLGVGAPGSEGGYW
jgi:hypothetical protein